MMINAFLASNEKAAEQMRCSEPLGSRTVRKNLAPTVAVAGRFRRRSRSLDIRAQAP